MFSCCCCSSSPRTTGGNEDLCNDDEAVIYVRSKPTLTSGHSEAVATARSKSNQLAYEIKTARSFHDIKVIVTDFGDFGEKLDRHTAERVAKDREGGEGSKKKTKGNAAEREKKQKKSITERLQREGVKADDLPKAVDDILKKQKEKEKENIAAKEAKARSADRRAVEDMMEIVKIEVLPSRPGMAAAIAVGAQVLAHSSMKGMGEPNRHRVVQEALDQLGVLERVGAGIVNPITKRDRAGRPVGKMEPWHGQCAEVAAVSDYLHWKNPSGSWTLQQAKAHFQKEEAVSFAHRPNLSDGTPATEYTAEVPACGSCTFMLTTLGISHRS